MKKIAVFLVSMFFVISLSFGVFAKVTSNSIEFDSVSIPSVEARVAGCEYSFKNAEIDRYVSLGLADSSEDAINKIILDKKIIPMEANKRGIFISDDEVTSLIETQKQLIKENPELARDFEDYVNQLGISKDEYWIEYYEEYRHYLEKCELQELIYDEVLEEMLTARLDNLNVELNQEDFEKLFISERAKRSSVVTEKFNVSYELFEHELLEAYDVEICY